MAQVERHDTDGLPRHKDAMTSALVAALYWIHKSWHCYDDIIHQYLVSQLLGASWGITRLYIGKCFYILPYTFLFHCLLIAK